MGLSGSTAPSRDQAATLRRLARGSNRRTMSIAVTSGKGGVGKTNIAVNLAICLARSGQRVTLVDLDVGLANADVLLDVQPRYNLTHVQSGQRSITEVMVSVQGGVHFVAGGSGFDGLVNMTDVGRRHLARQVCSINGRTDVVVYDCGAGISSNVLAFAVLADLILVVSTPEPTSITDAYAMVKVLSRNKYHGSIRLLVNMTADRDEAQRVYSRIAGVAERFLHFGLADGGYVVQDTHVELAVRRRSPFIVTYPRCPSSLCITALAASLMHASSPPAKQAGLLSRFVELFS